MDAIKSVELTFLSDTYIRIDTPNSVVCLILDKTAVKPQYATSLRTEDSRRCFAINISANLTTEDASEIVAYYNIHNTHQ
jgi:hypothetical protein